MRINLLARIWSFSHELDWVIKDAKRSVTGGRGDIPSYMSRFFVE
jgi:hypothetical protein